MSSTPIESLKRRIFKGVAWSVCMRWTIRLLGLISAAVLARLLSPEDYGIVAISLALLGFAKIFFEFGVEMAVLRDANAGRKEFDTAWSIRLLQSTVVFLLVLLFAKPAAGFYGDERLVNVFYISALGFLIRGFENIGIIKFRKDLEFNKDYYFNVAKKVLSVVSTLILAFYFRSYYALVIGSVLHSLYGVLISYLMISYRPRLTFEGWREMWNFSKWVLVRNFANYFNGAGHQLILGKIAPLSVLGFYRWGGEINSITHGEILAPIRRSLMQGFVKLSHDTPYLISTYIKSQNAISTICVPIALGIGCIAEELIPLYLGGGDKWAPVIPLVQILSVGAFLGVSNAAAGNLLMVMGHVRNMAYSDLGRAALMLSLIYPFFLYWGINGVAILAVIIGALTVSYYMTVLHRVVGVQVTDVFRANVRATVSGLVMAAILYSPAMDLTTHLFTTLVLKIGVGALVYTGCVLALWLIMGKPEGIEREVIELVSRRLQRLSKGGGGAL